MFNATLKIQAISKNIADLGMIVKESQPRIRASVMSGDIEDMEKVRDRMAHCFCDVALLVNSLAGIDGALRENINRLDGLILRAMDRQNS
jgi:hypothetical protein